MTGTALQDKADVRAGDQLATGPAGQSTFVPGIAIGTVTRVSTAADGTLSVSIRPSAPQTGLNLVGIVLTQTRTTGRTAIGTGR
jgi:rod shape-determining protein MreC